MLLCLLSSFTLWQFFIGLDFGITLLLIYKEMAFLHLERCGYYNFTEISLLLHSQNVQKYDDFLFKIFGPHSSLQCLARALSITILLDLISLPAVSAKHRLLSEINA